MKMEVNSKGVLSEYEYQLQKVIQDLDDYIMKDLKFTNDTSNDLRATKAVLLQQMRIIRRWRNGSGTCTKSDLKQFSQNLIKVRLGIVKTMDQVCLDSIEDIDSLLQKLDKYSSDVTSQRQNIGLKMLDIHSKMDTLRSDKSQDVTKADQDIDQLNQDILSLKQILTEQMKIQTKRKSMADQRNSMIGSLTIDMIEDHPEVNRVLRNAAKIRRMAETLREGGHVDIKDKATAACMENDIEVLQRQAGKVQQWQHGAHSFTGADVDDLELILGAIQRHIRSDIDLESPKKRLSQIKTTPNSSRPSSRQSGSSSETSYISLPPLSSEAPPPYEESFSMAASHHPSSENNNNDNSSDNEDIVNERLI